jgi:hypothetical protein
MPGPTARRAFRLHLPPHRSPFRYPFLVLKIQQPARPALGTRPLCRGGDSVILGLDPLLTDLL